MVAPLLDLVDAMKDAAEQVSESKQDQNQENSPHAEHNKRSGQDYVRDLLKMRLLAVSDFAAWVMKQHVRVDQNSGGLMQALIRIEGMQQAGRLNEADKEAQQLLQQTQDQTPHLFSKFLQEFMDAEQEAEDKQALMLRQLNHTGIFGGTIFDASKVRFQMNSLLFKVMKMLLSPDVAKEDIVDSEAFQALFGLAQQWKGQFPESQLSLQFDDANAFALFTNWLDHDMDEQHRPMDEAPAVTASSSTSVSSMRPSFTAGMSRKHQRDQEKEKEFEQYQSQPKKSRLEDPAQMDLTRD